MRTIANRYERDPKARIACIKRFGPVCMICKMDLAEIYGPIASGLVHVHHLVPLSKIKRAYEVDPIKDLIPVCPNCHTVIHYRSSTPRSPEEVGTMIELAKAKRG